MYSYFLAFGFCLGFTWLLSSLLSFNFSFLSQGSESLSHLKSHT